jgi:hypothetical protein
MPFSGNPFPLFRIFSVIEGECGSFAPTEDESSISLLEAKRRYRWCQKWTEALARLRQDFNGDLDQYLLFLVFKQGEMATVLSALGNGDGAAASLDRELRGMNAMSVAEICGIPRETARRKLKRLVERKIIGIGPDGLYYLAPTTSAASAIEGMAGLYASSRAASAASQVSHRE